MNAWNDAVVDGWLHIPLVVSSCDLFFIPYCSGMTRLQAFADVPVAQDCSGSRVSSLLLKEKAKWEPLLRSKDELLQQKDLIIAR